MEIITLKGKRVNFKCEMCGTQGIGLKQVYEWVPPAKSLTGSLNKEVCGNCARREIGSKNVKKWRELNEWIIRKNSNCIR